MRFAVHFPSYHAQTLQRGPCPAGAPIQLPLFAEPARLVRIVPEINAWRFYGLEVWPDLFSRALLLRQ